MSKLSSVETGLLLAITATVIFQLMGFEMLPANMLDYLLRSNLVYKGF